MELQFALKSHRTTTSLASKYLRSDAQTYTAEKVKAILHTEGYFLMLDLAGWADAEHTLSDYAKSIREAKPDETKPPQVNGSAELDAKARLEKGAGMGTYVFIGHGRSNLWHQVASFLREDLGLKTDYFEKNSRAGEQVVTTLNGMLDRASYAVIVATADDEMGDQIRARQNVVHEVGLFQGRLGFDHVAVLRQNGIEDWSNLAGLLVLPFENQAIESTFLALSKALRHHKIVQ
ncbi:MAG: hypothetical protein EON58_01965 [Alphaproteobacteria bacterium]|nr:MAG: hypothetical protein EON58_01965 [Alphaproteobacteria bacterium]